MEPGDAAVVRSVAEAVSLFRPRAATDGELEMRLGACGDGGRFTAGVPKCVFQQLERDLQDSPTLEAEGRWAEIVDYYYTGGAGERLRTRVEFDSENMRMGTTHVRKEVVHSAIVCREDDARDACRVTFSIEHPVDNPPASCVVHYCRVKQRKRVVDRREGGVVWAYELSRTWSASSRDAVEHQQRMVEPVYEVECELVDEGGRYLDAHDDERVARSVLMKTKLLLGEEVDARVVLTGVRKHPAPPLAPPPKIGRKRARDG